MHGRPGARVHHFQFEGSENQEPLLMDAPAGVRRGASVFLWRQGRWLEAEITGQNFSVFSVRLVLAPSPRSR